MKPDRLLAFAMIAIETAIVEYMLFLYEWYPAVIAALALIATPGMIALPLGRTGKIIGALGIALFIYAGMYTNMLTFLVAHRLPFDPVLGGSALVLAWYLLTLQAAMLFLRMKNGRLPLYFPVMGVVVMGCAGAIGRHGSLDPLFHAASLAFVVLIVLFVSGVSPRTRAGAHWAGQTRGRLIKAAVLVVSLATAFVFSNIMGSYRREIDNAFFVLVPQLLTDAPVGFSTRARLDSITRLRDTNAKAVALRVFSERSPGYLRGRAYDSYANKAWDVTFPALPMSPLTDRPNTVEPRKGELLFGVRSVREPYDKLTIAPMVKAEGCLFVPLKAAYVALPGVAPSIDGNGNVSLSAATSVEYDVYASAAPVTGLLPDDDRSRFLALPEDLDPRIRDLAKRLFSQAGGPREKMLEVAGYFGANYKYQMGIEVPPGQDPLTYFLIEQPPAHCEYFATGAAVLLRLGGVPCRYVTGFVAGEHNSIGGYWIARSRDAHAWVEAYDDEANEWLTVEPTVADGLPSSRQGNWRDVFAHLMDAIRYVVQRVKAAILVGHWQELIREAAARLFKWCVSPAGLFIIVTVAGYTFLRRLRRRAKAKPEARLEPCTAALIRLRGSVDRRVRHLGFARRPEETVNAFADRIGSALAAVDADAKAPVCRSVIRADRLRHAADWYRTYCEIRFSGSITPKQVEDLRSEWITGEKRRDKPARCKEGKAGKFC